MAVHKSYNLKKLFWEGSNQTHAITFTLTFSDRKSLYLGAYSFLWYHRGIFPGGRKSWNSDHLSEKSYTACIDISSLGTSSASRREYLLQSMEISF